MADFDEMKLARVIDAAGEVEGRTKLQKIVYLLWAMGYELSFDDFVIHQHGPYSRGVACATDILTVGEFVEEKPEEFGIDPATGEPMTRYVYKVREGLSKLLTEVAQVEAPPGKPPLKEAVKRLGGYKMPVLEVAATRDYLERKEGLTGADLERELKQIKGHRSKHFANAKKLLGELKDEKLL